MPYDIDSAVRHAERLSDGLLKIIVKDGNADQTDIILRNPSLNDRLHGHIAILKGEQRVVAWARPYGEERRLPRCIARSR